LDNGDKISPTLEKAMQNGSDLDREVLDELRGMFPGETTSNEGATLSEGGGI
jgi:hypothetical protein